MVTNVSCLEVVDKTGTVYARHDVRVRLEYEDSGRTLKVYVEDREDAGMEDYFRQAGRTVRAALLAYERRNPPRVA